MDNDESNKLDNIIRRLDVIAVFLLAQKGLTQKEIAKILSVGNHRIQDIFGKNYEKIQP